MTSTHSSRGGVALWLGHVVQVLFGAYNGSIGVGWTYIEKTYDLGLESLGIFLAAAMIARLLCSFASGKVIAVLGVRAVILTGVSVAGLGIAAHAFVPTWGTLLMAAFAVGVGDSLFVSAMSSYVVSNYNARRVNWLLGTFGVGLMLGPQLITIMVTDFGYTWQNVYLLIGLVVLVCIALMLPTSAGWVLHHATAEQVEGHSLRLASIRQTLSLRLFWFIMLFFFLYAGIEVATGQFANALFTDGRGVDPRTASTWVSLYWGSFAMGRLLIGSVVERIGRTRLLRLLTIGSIMGALLIWLVRDPALGWIGMLVMGFAMSAILPTMTTQTPQRFGTAHTPNAIGIQMGMAALGAAILPSIAGYVAAEINIELISPLLLVQAVLMFALHEYIVRIQASTPAPAVATEIGLQ